jgi:hypothetical protein
MAKDYRMTVPPKEPTIITTIIHKKHIGYGEQSMMNSTMKNAHFLYKHNTRKVGGMLTTIIQSICQVKITSF